MPDGYQRQLAVWIRDFSRTWGFSNSVHQRSTRSVFRVFNVEQRALWKMAASKSKMAHFLWPNGKKVQKLGQISKANHIHSSPVLYFDNAVDFGYKGPLGTGSISPLYRNVPYN